MKRSWRRYNALYVIDELSRIQEADPADFQGKLWTIRGDGATYRDGEEQIVEAMISYTIVE